MIRLLRRKVKRDDGVAANPIEEGPVYRGIPLWAMKARLMRPIVCLANGAMIVSDGKQTPIGKPRKRKVIRSRRPYKEALKLAAAVTAVDG